MAVAALVLQVLALLCLILAAFAWKIPHVDSVGWLGLALFVAGIVLPALAK